MLESNIVAESNVYLSRTDSPYWDTDFIAQIKDYELLKHIESKRQSDRWIASFSDSQRRMLEIDMRCTFAKKDPCWGLDKDGDRVRCACINGACSKLFKCNPDYTEADAIFWTTSDEEKNQYGKPDFQPRYYFVDMISDEEMTRYDSNPRNEGYEYSVPKAPILSDGGAKGHSTAKIKIDPLTGRKMVIIGHEWLITDNANYENEELVPIWGYVEEVEDKKIPIVRKKAKRIVKIETCNQRKKKQVLSEEKEPDPDYFRQEDFENTVGRNVSSEIKLTKLGDENIDSVDTVILCDNPAELSFVSGTLLETEIKHSVKFDEGVRLALVDDFERFSHYKHIMITNTVLKSGCKKSNFKAWRELAKKSEIEQLNIGERDYYNFQYDKFSRWTCRNMYGVTHVCVNETDMKDIVNLTDGLYSVSIVVEGGTFVIFDESGNKIGYLGKAFEKMIMSLKEKEEIPGLPAVIKGISLNFKGKKIDILGMGHMKFNEY